MLSTEDSTYYKEKNGKVNYYLLKIALKKEIFVTKTEAAKLLSTEY